MTVSTTTSRADYTGNGVTTAFTVPFYFLDDSHLLVLRTQLSTGSTTTLTLTTDYTVSGAGVSSGGTITCTTAPTSDQKISILRNVPLTQLVDYVENDPFPAATHERALDQLTMLVQQLAEGQNRALTLSQATTGVSANLPNPSANLVIGWNSGANALVNVDANTLATSITYGQTRAQTASGNGSNKNFTLTSSAATVNNVQVFISGVRQTPLVDYTLAGDGVSLSFVSAPPAGTGNILFVWQQVLPTTSVPDNAVVTSKIVDQNVTTAKIADTAVTTAKIADTAVTTAKIADAAITPAKLMNGGAELGIRNRIINGACNIAQRGSSVVVTSGAGALYGGPDRFVATNAGAGGQFTQSQGSLTFNGVTKNTVRHTVNTAATSIASGNYWHGIHQIIEGVNAYDLKGKKVGLSFIFNTNVSGVYSVSVRDGATAQSYVTTITAVANTPTLFKITIPTVPAAASIPNSSAFGFTVVVGFLNTGTYQTATLNAWQAGNFVSASGATNWGAAAGNFIELTDLQLEEGEVTRFEYRPYGTELALCQRYYVEVPVTPTSGSIYAYTFLPVPMRADPTITLKSGALNGATYSVAPYLGSRAIRQNTNSSGAVDATLACDAEL